MLSRPKATRKLFGFALGLVCITGLLMALSLWNLRRQAMEAGDVLTASLVRIVQEQADSTLQTVDQRLQLATSELTSLGLKQHLTIPAVQAMLREQIKEMPFVRAMWVMDAQGRIVYDSDNGNIGVDLSGRAYFQVFKTAPQTQLYLGAPVKSRQNIWVISVSRPLHDAQGNFTGIIVAALDPGYFDKLWSNLNLGPDGSVSLFRSDAMLMMRSPLVDASLGTSFPDFLFFKMPPDHRSAEVLDRASPLDGVRRHYAFRSLEHYPAAVILGKSHTSILSDWQLTATLTMVIWALACGLEVFMFVLLARDATRRHEVEDELLAKKAKLSAMLDALPDLMFEVDAEGRYYDYHSPRSDLLAAEPEVFMGRLINDILPADAARQTMDALRDAAGRGYSSGTQIELPMPQGPKWFELSIARKQTIPDEGVRFIVLSRDITTRKSGEMALQGSLHEKVSLLNEVHHRVKNNLQVIASLLRLESGRSENAETRAVLGDMQGRIRSMALLHESLYRSGTFASVRLDEYLKQLCHQAFRASAQANGAVRLQLDLHAAQATLDQATPAGLLVNELLSNSLKHGFPAGRSGEVHIALRPVADSAAGGTDASRLWRLSVKDNGIGLPADFEQRRAASLGLQLVFDLATQLGGGLAVGMGPGAEFSVVFALQQRPDVRP
jgi:two-component sensor histidine kinase/PAS domain-containing protein